jgi:8-amino-3,8-dideoxy-alpha-D-manno-octulosonate transaminase
MQKCKYGIDELMEVMDVFNVPAPAAAQIRAILSAQDPEPSAGVFFRYYNPRSKTEEFERCFAAHLGSRHALAVNSGTSALIASLVAAGIGPGDEVILPAYTFFASVSAVVVARAIPVIVDIDESLTLSPQAFEKAITPRTKAVMPVHMLGLPARMDVIMDIARKHKLLVIEDAAQACGGSFQGKFLGTWGDLGCISLDAYKVIGTGEGGVVLTDSDWYCMRAQSYHDTAACWRPDRFGKERQPGELFCGENYRMSELSAAVALAQLRKLDWIISTCRRNCNIIRDNCPLPAGVKWLECADPDGICGYTLPLLFDDKEFSFRAQNAKILGGNAGDATRGVRNWHMAWHWEHILEQKTATAEGCPFKCPLAKEVPQYHVDSWPQSRDIIHRVGTISVGAHLSVDECKALGAKISAGLAHC